MRPIETLIIEVPDMNDSFMQIVLLGKPYQIRFTYIDTFDYWIFGLFDAIGNPIVTAIKVVPGVPLNTFCRNEDIPQGIFGVISQNERIGRSDFVEGKARFVFMYNSEEEQ